MGRPLPGYRIELLDPEGRPAGEGEISLRLDPRPAGLMAGYLNDPERTDEVMAGGFYRTGDVASRDAEGYVTYVGRADDVFKSSDYRISPFELESVMVEHPRIAEAAVVPSPDPLRLSVPKAYLVLRPGMEPSRELALEIWRVELRAAEEDRGPEAPRTAHEYWEEDFPELRGPGGEARGA